MPIMLTQNNRTNQARFCSEQLQVKAKVPEIPGAKAGIVAKTGEGKAIAAGHERGVRGMANQAARIAPDRASGRKHRRTPRAELDHAAWCAEILATLRQRGALSPIVLWTRANFARAPLAASAALEALVAEGLVVLLQPRAARCSRQWRQAKYIRWEAIR